MLYIYTHLLQCEWYGLLGHLGWSHDVVVSFSLRISPSNLWKTSSFSFSVHEINTSKEVVVLSGSVDYLIGTELSGSTTQPHLNIKIQELPTGSRLFLYLVRSIIFRIVDQTSCWCILTDVNPQRIRDQSHHTQLLTSISQSSDHLHI